MIRPRPDTTWVVGPGGDFESIRAALKSNAVRSGATLLLLGATFRECNLPNYGKTNITIRSHPDAKMQPVVDGENRSSVSFHPNDGWQLSGVTIQNFTKKTTSRSTARSARAQGVFETLVGSLRFVEGSPDEPATAAATTVQAFGTVSPLIVFPDLPGTSNETLDDLRAAWNGQFDQLQANQRALRGKQGLAVIFPVNMAYARWTAGGGVPNDLARDAPEIPMALTRLDTFGPSPAAIALGCESGLGPALREDAAVIRSALVAHRAALPGELAAWKAGCALDWLLQELIARLDFVLGLCATLAPAADMSTSSVGAAFYSFMKKDGGCE